MGVGLLGGSLGLALRARGIAAHVAGLVRRDASVPECTGKGAVDSASTRMAEVVEGADVVVLCTPVGDMARVARDLAPFLSRDAWVTDVGSVKATVVREVSPVLPPGRFVGSHPMAGSEQAGVGAARADLFEGARCAVTPAPDALPEVVDAVASLWRAVGAEVVRMSPESHDAWVARASHLPHVLAAVLAHEVLDPRHPAEVGRLCATGFRDTTRVAGGHPGMWRDILMGNRPAVLAALADWQRDLRQFEALLAAGDEAGIERFLAEAQQRRNGWGRPLPHPAPGSPQR